MFDSNENYALCVNLLLTHLRHIKSIVIPPQRFIRRGNLERIDRTSGYAGVATTKVKH